MVALEYVGMADRQVKIAVGEGQGLVMLHDDFAPDWKPGDEPHGTLTFTEPTPPSPEELYQAQLAHEMNEIHLQAIAAYKNWVNLTAAQKDAVMKGLVKWALWKDGWLKLGAL